MSLSQIPLQLTQSLDPITQINNVRTFCVEKGASDVFYTVFPSSGVATINQNTFTCNPISRETITSRKIYMRNTYLINLNGTNTLANPQYLYQPGISGALRSLPITSSLKTIKLGLGDSEYSTNINEYMTAFQRYAQEFHLEDHDYSTSPAMPDMFQVYSQADGTNLNPLSSYGTNTSQCPRGGFSLEIITNPLITPATSGTCQLKVTVTEPLWLSPLIQHGDKSGFVGIDKMSVSYVYDGNIVNRFWSQMLGEVGNTHSNIIPLTSIDMTAVTAQVLVKQLTPRIVEPIPRNITYGYNAIESYTSQPYLLTGWSSSSLTSTPNTSTPTTLMASYPYNIGNITLNTVPNRLYIYARQQNSDLTYNSSDVFGVIQNISINWGGRVLLSSATQQDLYQISVRNGCNLSFPQWSNFVGSVLAIDFAKDIGLASNQAPALLDRSTLSITCTVANSNPNSITYELYCLVIEEGTTSIVEGHVVKNVGVISQRDVLNSDASPMTMPMKHLNVYGSGSFFGDLWTGIKKGINIAKEVAGPIGDIVKVARTVSGNGVRHGDGLSGGRRRSRSRSGSRRQIRGRGLDTEHDEDSTPYGGKMIKRSDLKRH